MYEYFHECHWGQCLELLCHLCQYSESILLVTGPEGIGKTAMKQALMDQEADQYVFCEIQGTPSLTADQISMQIENDVDAVDEKDLLLVIDDAQFLTLDVLGMILQLKQSTAIADRLHIVLFADAELEQKIAHSILKDDFANQVHTIEIEPLAVAEVEAFLRQQWRATHRNDDMPLDRAKCKKIHAQTGGLPGKVQEVAEQMMAGKKTIAQASQALSPFAIGVTVSFGILFCILAVLWPTADKDIITKAETTSTMLPLQLAKQDVAVDVEIAAGEDQLENKVVEVDNVLDPNPVVELAVAAPAADAGATSVTVTSTVAVAANQPESYDEKIASLERKVDDLQKQLTLEQKALRTTESKLQQLMTHKPQAVVKSQAIGKTQAAGKHAIKTAKKLPGIFKQEKHILALPGNYYTLQLLCMNHEQQVQSFIKKHNLQDKASYYKTHLKGKDRFIVVYGSYANKNDAQLALTKLPTEIKKLQPWAREYASIQYTINNRDKHE